MRSRLLTLVVVAAAAFAAAGCDVLYVPEVGPLAATPSAADGGVDDGTVAAACVDSDPTVGVSFAQDVRPLISRSPGGCSCHASNATSGFNLGSYERLRQGGINSGQEIIVPGQPCESVLVHKLGLAPSFGARMPYNGPPYFTEQERRLVQDWIAEGAENN
jgi:hypothetical protein